MAAVPLKEPTPDQLPIVWAWRKSLRHVNKFVVGTLIFTGVNYLTGAIFGLPSDPSWTQRIWNALANVGAATIVVFVGLFLLMCLLAPYEQRKALLRERSDAVAQQETTGAAKEPAELEVQATVSRNQIWVTATNKGATDHFHAVLVTPDDREFLLWNDQRKGPREQILVHGGFGHVAPIFRTSPPNEMPWSIEFLPRVLAPYIEHFTARVTPLGVRDIKCAAGPWPIRTYEWFTAVAAVIHDVERIERDVVALSGSQPDEAKALWRHTYRVFTDSDVIGGAFWNVDTNTDAASKNDYLGALQRSLPVWSARLREAVRAEAAYKTDVTNPKAAA